MRVDWIARFVGCVCGAERIREELTCLSRVLSGQDTAESESDRSIKRQRLRIESTASSKVKSAVSVALSHPGECGVSNPSAPCTCVRCVQLWMQNDELQKEIETLHVQIQRNTEMHQIELKERDTQLDQLRRQLQYAVVEEEETRSELKAVTNEYSSEKLQLQKKIVELDSKLQFVDTSLNEWKEKALDSASELRTVSRQSKLKVRRVCKRKV